jgi:hypothetical protein
MYVNAKIISVESSSGIGGEERKESDGRVNSSMI